MARAAVRVDDLEQGNLPAVCAKTGVPCDGLVRDSLRVVPAWVAALVYTVVPFLILRLYFSRRVEAKLPIAADRVEKIRRLVRGAWVAMVIGAAGLMAAIFGAGWVGVLAQVVGIVAYLGIVFAGDLLWVGAVATRRLEVVILRRVHPEFARALNEQYDGGLPTY